MPLTSKKSRQKKHKINTKETLNGKSSSSFSYSQAGIFDAKQASYAALAAAHTNNKHLLCLTSLKACFYKEKKSLSRLFTLLPAFLKTKMAHYVNHAIDSHSFHVVRSAS
ncbi:hypothetical protein [uncultured Shewanella sp.]|uniref:hypothetical protein n=1 Tax=uncultured Shewanella sp. TaxID=173975 RepID=UPI00261B7AA0|nr:hypothetical protein [uncultured Shewanella sp.]